MRFLLIRTGDAAGTIQMVVDVPEGTEAPAGYSAVPSPSGNPGDRYLDGTLTPYVAPPPNLALLKTALQGDIDTQAQAIRDRYVTPGGAQAATYMFKQTQAVQALAAQATADAGKTADQLAALYPDLANEIGITADPSTSAPATDVYGVMRAVLATLQIWLPLNRAIEAMRLKTKNLIAAATTVADAQAAHDGVTWPGA